jgi:hypothetical protein
MAVDRSDAVVIAESPAFDTDRKVIYEPRSDGGWTRVVKTWDADRGHFRVTGTADVDTLAVSTPD